MKIQIERPDLVDAITAALKNAESNGLSGFGLPLYVDDAGSISEGGWLQASCWQPNKIELCRILPWKIEDIEGYEYDSKYTREEAIEDYIDLEGVDYYLDVVESRLDSYDVDPDTYEHAYSIEII